MCKKCAAMSLRAFRRSSLLIGEGGDCFGLRPRNDMHPFDRGATIRRALHATPSPNQIYLTWLIKVLINEQLSGWPHCDGLTGHAAFLTDQGYPAAGEGAVEILNGK